MGNHMNKQTETGNEQGVFLEWEKDDGNQVPLTEEEIEEVNSEIRF